MRVTCTAFRVFLALSLAGQSPGGAFHARSFLPGQYSASSSRPTPSLLTLKEQNDDGSFFGFIKKLQDDWSSSPETSKALGIEANKEAEPEPAPKEEKEEKEAMEGKPFMVEATGKPLTLTPHPPKEAPPTPVQSTEQSTEELLESVEELVESVEAELSVLKKKEEQEEKPKKDMEEMFESVVETEVKEAKKEPPKEEKPKAEVKPKKEVPPPAFVAAIEKKLEEPILTKETTQEVSKATIAVVDKVVSPILGREIEKGVPLSTIQSTSIACGLFALIMSQGDIQVAIFTAITVAIFSITPGPIGETLRTIGDVALDTLYRVSSLSNKLGVTDAVSEKLARVEYGSKVEKLKTIEQNLQLALELAESNLKEAATNNMGQAETIQASVKQVLREADQAIANALQIQEDKIRLAEEELKELQWEEKAKQADDTLASLVKEANRLAQEADDLAQEGAALRSRIDQSGVDLSIPYDAAAMLAYEKAGSPGDYGAFKTEYEADAVADVIAKKLELEAKLAEEEARLALEARIAEEERIAEENRLKEIEETKLLQARIAEEERIAEEKRLKEIEETRALEARIAEEERIAEEKRLKEIEETRALEARIAEEERIAEEKRLKEIEETKALEARIAEEERIAEEKRLKEVEETKLLQARIAEEERIAAEQREEEIKQTELLQARIAEEEQKAEEARLAEEQRLADEEEAARLAAVDPIVDDDNAAFTDEDEEWDAAIDMAKGNVDGIIVGVEDAETDESKKADWDAAGKFAQSLGGAQGKEGPLFDDEEPEVIDMDLGGEMDMEALARAAREAVEKYEQEAAGQGDGSANVEGEDDDDFSGFLDPEGSDFEDVAAAARAAVEQAGSVDMDDDVDEIDFEDDELLKAARAAVAVFDENMEDELLFDDEVEEPAASAEPKEPTTNWSKLKVVELRAELKGRGLSTAGKKTDLVAMLEQYDMDLQERMAASESSSTSASPTGEIDFSDMDLDEIAKAAREAAELFDGEEPSDEVLMMLENEELTFDDVDDLEGDDGAASGKAADYSSMTVTELKDALRSKGLKLGGKKADLIERLRLAD